MPFGYGKLKTKRKKKRIPPQRKRTVEKYEQTVSEYLEEEQIVLAPSSIFDVNQYLKYVNDKQRPLFDHAFSVRYTVEFVFLNRYDATENDPWGGKGGIILKLRNDNNISNGNNSSMIRGIMKEVLLAKADGVKFEPDLKGWSKTGRKSIIYMDYKELNIINDAMDSGMRTLTAWLLANNHR